MSKDTVLLNDFATFYAGINISRVSINDDKLDNWAYTIEDFETDFSCVSCPNNRIDFVGKDKKLEVNAGDCIISLAKSKATIVGNSNVGKCITANFIKCDLDTQKINPWFFCFMFNENTEIKKQLNMSMQGTISCIKRITLADLKSLEIDKTKLPSLDQQRIIGHLYYDAIKNETLIKKKAEQQKEIILATLKQL